MIRPSDTEAAITRLLAEHEHEIGLGCKCGGIDWRKNAGPMKPIHRAHVAAVLAAHMADREADAWDAGMAAQIAFHRACRESSVENPRVKVPANPFRLTPDTEADA